MSFNNIHMYFSALRIITVVFVQTGGLLDHKEKLLVEFRQNTDLN